jgi:hypothetical protein
MDKMPRQKITLNLPLWVYKEIKDYSNKTGLSMTSVIIEVIRERLDKKK